MGLISIMGALAGAGVLLGGGALLYVIRQMSKLPDTAPLAFLNWDRRTHGKRVVVCWGASLVHGRVGVSFVDQLAARFPPPGTVIVNAGLNGDTAYHALQRLDAVVACAPDVVVILVGTNDVIGLLNPDAWRAYGRRRPPQPPSLAWYRENITTMVRQVRAQTGARVALCGLPVLGEDLTAPANACVRECNAALQAVAAAEDVAYLPVYEAQAAWLAAQQAPPGRPYTGDAQESLRLGFLANVQHYLFGVPYDTIAARRGLRLTVDLVHCNGQGAAIIADQIAAFLQDEAPVEVPAR
jgi:lysophospholipase L1-like esterase